MVLASFVWCLDDDLVQESQQHIQGARLRYDNQAWNGASSRSLRERRYALILGMDELVLFDITSPILHLSVSFSVSRCGWSSLIFLIYFFSIYIPKLDGWPELCAPD